MKRVNGIDLELIFDTGASDVSISLNEADSMFKNGTLTKSDIIGTSNYLNASGEINEGIVINIKEIEIAGLTMKNIKASVVKNLNAPLLLGQTAISKLGEVQLNLNNNTLIILNGKGAYDYSTYSLTDKLEKYYQDFSIVNIEKKDSKEGVHFSYTIPNKWKEETVTNPTVFKNYVSDEYPYGLIYELKIGLQTLPTLYNDYDSCQHFVDYINNLTKKVDTSFRVISTSNVSVSYCKAIKNVISKKSQEFYILSNQYWIFCGNKYVSFIYSAFTLDPTQLISISSDFDEFCESEVSNILVYNIIENAATCTLQSFANENKKDISIILNNTCKWIKSEGPAVLTLENHSTNSILYIDISEKNDDFKSLSEMNTSDLNATKNGFINGISKDQRIESSSIITINKKKYIYIFTKWN